jgi:hypothetical protein
MTTAADQIPLLEALKWLVQIEKVLRLSPDNQIEYQFWPGCRISVAPADNHTQITLRFNSLNSREEQNVKKVLKAIAAQ